MSLTPGALLLQVRQRFGRGLNVAYYRDVVRPKILRAPPLADTTDGRIEIHVLTSQADWLNLVWTLRSFYAVSPYRLSLCIHADAQLEPAALDALRRQFPAARVLDYRPATEEVLDHLASYPRCRRLRERNVLSIKVFDFMHFLRGDRMALFDSDLLFFAQPTAWLDHVDSGRRTNVFNSDASTCYAVSIETLSEHGIAAHPNVNSGFGVVWKDSMRLDWIEEFLAIPGLADGHLWRIEQTLFALCSSRFGVELLPDDYKVYLDKPLGGRPFRHYVGQIRHLMYSQGMRQLRASLLAGV